MIDFAVLDMPPEWSKTCFPGERCSQRIALRRAFLRIEKDGLSQCGSGGQVQTDRPQRTDRGFVSGMSSESPGAGTD